MTASRVLVAAVLVFAALLWLTVGAVARIVDELTEPSCPDSYNPACARPYIEEPMNG